MPRNFRFKFSWCKTWCTILFCFAYVEHALACPLLCECGVLGVQKYVQCHNLNFKALPKEIPSDTELLFLSSTKITQLTEGFFSRLSNLNTIELSNNQIENITSGVFNGLTKLETLNLPNNGIQRVEENAFAGLSTLTKLSLSNNRLSNLPSNLIKDLTSLSTLNLDKNAFQTIPRGFFNNTLKLQTLKLNNNNLTAIDDELLQRLNNLKNLDLSKNQITEIGDHAFREAGAKLNSLLYRLNGNKLSSFPNALYDFKKPLLFELLLQDNMMTTIPQEAQSVFDEIKFGKIRLSGNPYICDSRLRWLQKWVNAHVKLVKDINDIMCTALNGDNAMLTKYDFNKTVSSSIAPTSTSATSSSTSSILPVTSSTSSSPTSSTILPATSSTKSSTKSMPTTSKTETSSVYTTHAPSTTSIRLTSSTSQIQTTMILSTSHSEVTSTTSEVYPTASEIVTIFSDKVSSTQQIPGKVNTSTKMRKEHIILATCLSAAFIAIVVFVAMYCFRRKIIKQAKLSNTRYDRVRIV